MRGLSFMLKLKDFACFLQHILSYAISFTNQKSLSFNKSERLKSLEEKEGEFAYVTYGIVLLGGFILGAVVSSIGYFMMRSSSFIYPFLILLLFVSLWYYIMSCHIAKWIDKKWQELKEVIMEASRWERQ